MGLDNDGVSFAIGAKAAGVDFARTLMLGRQNFFPTAAHFQRTMADVAPAARLEEVLAARGGYAEPFFELLGATDVASVDASSYENASLVHDLNVPIPVEWRGRYTAVLDGGSLEHVFDIPRALQNVADLLAPGGHFLGITPANNFMGHGFYQFSPELYFRVFAPANGFRMRAMFIKSCSPRSGWYRVPDPEAVHERVELQNGLPTLLYVLAQKLEEMTLTTFRPQQSDYAAAWQAAGGEAPAKTRSAGQRLPAFIANPLRRLLPVFANAPFQAKSRWYRAITENDLLSGKF